MKYIITLLIVCASNFLFAQTTGNIELTINGQTTREQLNQMRKDLHSQGVVFTYAPQFDHERHLTALKYKFTTVENAVLGSGEHIALQQNEANIRIQLNPTSMFFSEEKDIAPRK